MAHHLPKPNLLATVGILSMSLIAAPIVLEGAATLDIAAAQAQSNIGGGADGESGGRQAAPDAPSAASPTPVVSGGAPGRTSRATPAMTGNVTPALTGRTTPAFAGNVTSTFSSNPTPPVGGDARSTSTGGTLATNAATVSNGGGPVPNASGNGADGIAVGDTAGTRADIDVTSAGARHLAAPDPRSGRTDTDSRGDTNRVDANGDFARSRDDRNSATAGDADFVIVGNDALATASPTASERQFVIVCRSNSVQSGCMPPPRFVITGK